MSAILSLQSIRKSFAMRRRLLGRRRAPVVAVDDVSLEIEEGSCFGLVGESGSGKSTLAQLIVGLATATSGRMLYRGAPAGSNPRRDIQMVFQDTHASLNPRKRIRRTLQEALSAAGAPPGRLDTLLQQIGLDAGLLRRYPHELSGGQRQRVGIARALAMEPSLLVADEPVSSLDVSLQGQIINLLRRINRELGVTIILISHDLAVVGRSCERIGVMYAGRIVELGPTAEVLHRPAHPYTQALLQAVPRGLARRGTRTLRPPGDDPPFAGGCRYQMRCGQAMPVCAQTEPFLRSVAGGHEAACHLVHASQFHDENVTS